jgi:putative transcriptional regulator
VSMESLKGKLLVSSPSLLDPNFRKTVVLIAHHDDDGALGLVLSRPSDVPAIDAIPSLEGIPGADGPVFVGGPVQPQSFMALAEFADVHEAAAPIFDHVGFMSADAEPEELSIRRVRLFAGYAGWGAGQLEAELAEPAWIVVPAERDDPFVDDPEALWREVVNRGGGSISLMKNMPFDPHLN